MGSTMPRSLRIQFPGAFNHVMVRGNQREAKQGLVKTSGR